MTIEDFDTPTPARQLFELRKTRRVDSYDVWVNGTFWKRCGWSKVCEALRKGHQRLPSPRSDVWQLAP